MEKGARRGDEERGDGRGQGVGVVEALPHCGPSGAERRAGVVGLAEREARVTEDEARGEEHREVVARQERARRGGGRLGLAGEVEELGAGNVASRPLRHRLDELTAPPPGSNAKLRSGMGSHRGCRAVTAPTP